MSFICENCNEQQKDRAKPNKIVVQTRKKIYPKRTYLKNGREMTDNGGKGWEIVQERDLCNTCYTYIQR